MGVSVPASTAILLVAALISFGVVHDAQDSAQKAFIEDQDSMFQRYNDAAMTTVEVNTALSIYDGATFLYSNITMTNTGDRPIDMRTLNIIINGYIPGPVDTPWTFEGYYNYTILNAEDSHLWLPGEVTVLSVYGDDAEFDVDSTNRIWVITANGSTNLLVYGGS